MAKVKIPKSKINDIKKKFSESKIEALLEESGEDLKESLSLEDAKQIAREQKVNETGYTPKEIKKNKKANIAKIKDAYSSERKIEAKWNFEIGDLVEFKTNQIGIVVDLSLSDNHKTAKHAKQTGSALVFSSIGRVWKSPAALRKIE